MKSLLLLLAAALVACSSHEVSRTHLALTARSVKFFNGVSMTVPAGMCLRESRGPDFSIYQLESENHILANMYIGTAGNYPFGDCQGAKTSTVQEGHGGNPGLLREEVTGASCGEVGLRPSDSLGYFVHLWWDSIGADDLKLIQELVRTATGGVQVPDDQISADILCVGSDSIKQDAQFEVNSSGFYVVSTRGESAQPGACTGQSTRFARRLPVSPITLAGLVYKSPCA